MENINTSRLEKLEINPKVEQDLKISANWGKAVALISVLSSCLSIIEALMKNKNIITEIALLAFTFFCAYFQFAFGRDVAKGIENNDQITMNDGFNSLRLYFRIYGILLILLIVVMLVLIVFSGYFLHNVTGLH
ncbi:hypothetical protein [Parasediminibacterium sp. JCM 36343]|uniref:hypothetical protein n=1 Tax=Parasediminibacterium sp. JCM 36343 TaxID=3374279 RepID=UPI00397C0CAA